MLRRTDHVYRLSTNIILPKEAAENAVKDSPLSHRDTLHIDAGVPWHKKMMNEQENEYEEISSGNKEAPCSDPNAGDLKMHIWGRGYIS